MNKYLSTLIIILIFSGCTIGEGDGMIPPIISIVETVELGVNKSSFKVKVENEPSQDFEIGICWNSSPGPVIENNHIPIIYDQDEITGTIENLEPGKIYYAKAYLSTAENLYYSEEIAFTTKSIQILCETVYKYDVEYDERAKIVRKTNDGGFLVCGWTNPVFGANHNNFDLVLLKFNANCEILWEKLIPGYLNVFNLIEETNGNILLITQEMDYGTNYPAVIKMDSQGNTIWDKKYKKETYSSLKDIVITENGEYNLIGTYSKTSEERFGWFVKLNSQGEMIYEKSYSKADMMIGKSMIRVNENGFYVVGDLQYESTFLYKLTNTGEIEWRKQVSKEPFDLNRSLTSTKDNKLLISGTTQRLGPDKSNLWLVKLSLDGEVLWESGIGKKHYLFNSSGNESPTEIIESKAGAIYMTSGGSYYPGEGSPTLHSNIWVFKINPINGELLWSQEYGSNEYYTWDLSYSLAELNIGEFIIVGKKEDDEARTISMTGDFWILKLKED
ncbi:hypothetical protein GCM10028791_33630 [Echinicola sediminis]